MANLFTTLVNRLKNNNVVQTPPVVVSDTPIVAQQPISQSNSDNSVYSDEQSYRSLFDTEIQLMKDRFELESIQKYPKFTKNPLNLSNEQLIQKISDIDVKLKEIKLSKGEIDNRKKLRLLNTPDDFVKLVVDNDNIAKQRILQNDALNDVEKQINDMKTVETLLGRPVIPHRDFEETDSNDIIVRGL